MNKNTITMPSRAPRICPCGHAIAAAIACPCEALRARERNKLVDARRPNAAARGYDAEWQRQRSAFLKVNPECRRCGDPATLVDHVMPHRGDNRRFRDRSNWQPLCTTCHVRWKQSQERRGNV
jgi:5-methylcytosine-specific restriction protein A